MGISCERKDQTSLSAPSEQKPPSGYQVKELEELSRQLQASCISPE
jgi:hypothetical protein